MIRPHILTLAALAATAVATAGTADAQAHGGGRGGGGYHGGGHVYGRGGYGGYRYGGGYRGPGFFGPGYYAPWYWGAYPGYGALYTFYPYYPYPYPYPYPYAYGAYGPSPPNYAPPPLPLPQQPAPAPARATAAPQQFLVYFPFDSSDLTAAAREVIRSAADYAARNPGGHVIIVGHTDTSGSEAYNQPLSERRARAVREALGGDGLDTASVEINWKGKHDLAVDSGDGVREPRNRRVTILIEPSARNEADAGDQRDM